MLPGLRQVFLAITATMVLVALGLGQLAKYEVAQTFSASRQPPDIRFAGLAFAERADWTPNLRPQRVSLETLAPFANVPIIVPPMDRAHATPGERAKAAIAALTVEQAAELTNAGRTIVEALPPTTATATALPVAALEPLGGGAREVALPAAGKAGRAVYAALPPPASDIAPIPMEQLEAAAPIPAAESVAVLVSDPGPAPAATGAAAKAAPLTTAIAAIPLSEVKLPVPRPIVAGGALPKAKTALANKNVARRATRRSRRLNKRAAAATAEPQNPFAALFGVPSTPATPRN